MLTSHSLIIPGKMLLKQYFASLRFILLPSLSVYRERWFRGGVFSHKINKEAQKIARKLQRHDNHAQGSWIQIRGLIWKNRRKNKPGFSRKNDLSLKRKRPRPLHSQIHRRAPLRKLRRRIVSGKRQYLLDRDAAF